MKKRILALVMCLALMACAVPVQAADGDVYTHASFAIEFVDATGLEHSEDMARDFIDLGSDDEAYEPICVMHYYGFYVSSDPSIADPEFIIRRDHAAGLLINSIMGREYEYEFISVPYDVNPEAWYAGKVAFVLDNNYMSVFDDGSFQPSLPACKGDIDFEKYGAAFIEMHGITTSPSVSLDITNGSIEISMNSSGQFIYSQNGTETVSTSNTCLIRQSDTSAPTANNITVKSGSVKINLAGVNIETNASETWAIKVESGSSLILALHEKNILCSKGYYSPGIWVPSGASISICGDGTLTTSSSYSSGIGAKSNNCGSITINGGTIHSSSKWDAAGIGGGMNGTCDQIIINGGNITAEGGTYAAGIGGGAGWYDNYGSITINGGTVLATGQNNSAGIGGGSDYHSNENDGSITITGGEITAVGAGCGAGIGGGYYDNGGVITISGGTITALGGTTGGTGIGGGSISHYENFGKGGTVVISNANITASGYYYAIGSGKIDNYYGCDKIDIGENVILNLSINEQYGINFYHERIDVYVHPQNCVALAGNTASFQTEAYGFSGISYQWQSSSDGIDWTDLDGQTSPEASISALKEYDGMNYRCKITNVYGNTVYTDAAVLSVNAVTYTTEFYLENADGSYTLASREVLESEAGKSVTAAQRSFDHYIENSSKGSHSGVVTSDSGLVLSRYYERQSHTISFVTNGAGAIDGITAKWGTAVSLPDSLSRYGFVFGGWYMDAGFETEANISEIPTQDITLYAKWTAVGAGRGIEYKINSISVMDGDYQSCDSIPEGVFYAQVSVTNLESETMDTLVLAAYSAEGQMLGLYFLMADPMAGQTFNLGAMIDNSNGAIAELRAFMLPMLGGELIPLANSVSFK